MLASFPFRVEAASVALDQFKFFAKDLFLGSEGEISRIRKSNAADPMSPTRHTITSALNQYYVAHGPHPHESGQGDHVKELSAIRVARAHLDGVLLAPKHEGGFDLNELLRNFVSKFSSEVLRSAPIMSIIVQVLPALVSNNLWASGTTHEHTSMARAPVSPRTPTTLYRIFRRSRSNLGDRVRNASDPATPTRAARFMRSPSRRGRHTPTGRG